jgi:hypothetical protein
VVIVKETYALAVQAKALRHRLTINENAWTIQARSLPARARLTVRLQPPLTFTCEIQQTATSLSPTLARV